MKQQYRPLTMVCHSHYSDYNYPYIPLIGTYGKLYKDGDFHRYGSVFDEYTFVFDENLVNTRAMIIREMTNNIYEDIHLHKKVELPSFFNIKTKTSLKIDYDFIKPNESFLPNIEKFGSILSNCKLAHSNTKFGKSSVSDNCVIITGVIYGIGESKIYYNSDSSSDNASDYSYSLGYKYKENNVSFIEYCKFSRKFPFFYKDPILERIPSNISILD